MTITYSLNENDFLQYHLFNASKSDRIKKQRRKSWFVNAILIFCFGFISYLNGNHVLVDYFLIAGILAVCLFPFYLRWYYKNHYKKFAKETYKKRVEEICTITFTEDYIESFGRTGTSKINMPEVEKVYETGQYFFLKLKTGSTLIIPKYKIDNIDDLRDEFIKIIDTFKGEFISDLDWRWK